MTIALDFASAPRKATSSKAALGTKRAPSKCRPPDHTPKKYTGPSRAELLAMRKQYTNPAIFTLYGEPLLIVEGHMQYLYDETGHRYLDMFAGIVTVSVRPLPSQDRRRRSRAGRHAPARDHDLSASELSAAGEEARVEDAEGP